MTFALIGCIIDIEKGGEPLQDTKGFETMGRKETSKMSRAVSRLEHMFNKINEDFFNNELPIPIITVQSSPRTYGHCTVAKVWKKKDGETYELNIAAEVLDYPIEEIVDTLAHEMIHIFCRENNIKEVSRGGVYHNKKFKELAEKIGLDVFYDKRVGWNTKPSDKILQYAIDNDWSEITLGRKTRTSLSSLPTTTVTIGTTTPPVRTSSTRKYKCPCCNTSVRATKDVNIMCADCMKLMIKC